jgi:hypothetical protein
LSTERGNRVLAGDLLRAVKPAVCQDLPLA